MAEKKNDFLTYKGKPLVRNGNTIYYGDMNDDFVIMMRILSSAIPISLQRYPFSLSIQTRMSALKKKSLKQAKKKVFMQQWILQISG